MAIEYRWAQGQNDRLPTLAAEMVRRQVSVIVILESTHGALSAKAATQTIPIVCMQAADPVRIGLVDSLNRPGGNLTGINLMLAETVGKRLERLLELVPAATSIAYLRNPTAAVFFENETRELQAVARERGIRLLVVKTSRPSEFEPAFADIIQQRADGLVVSSAQGSEADDGYRPHALNSSPLTHAHDFGLDTPRPKQDVAFSCTKHLRHIAKLICRLGQGSGLLQLRNVGDAAAHGDGRHAAMALCFRNLDRSQTPALLCRGLPGGATHTADLDHRAAHFQFLGMALWPDLIAHCGEGP